MDWVWDIIEKYRHNELQPNLEQLTETLSSITQTLANITNNMVSMQQDMSTLKEQQTTKKLPEKNTLVGKLIHSTNLTPFYPM